MNLRYFVARSSHPAAVAARRVVRAAREASLPAPRVVVLPLVRAWGAGQLLYYWLKRKLIVEPSLKAQVRRHGPRLHTGNFVHWISGTGDIVLGEDVHLGKCDIMFGALLPERPQLSIGDRSYVNHECSFSVASRVTIGANVYIASEVRFMDSPGHPLDPEARLQRRPPELAQVRPIRVEDNVWIGMRVLVMPGVTIGEGSVVAAASVVTTDVPPYSVVGGVPARVIRSLRAAPESPDAPTD